MSSGHLWFPTFTLLQELDPPPPPWGGLMCLLVASQSSATPAQNLSAPQPRACCCSSSSSIVGCGESRGAHSAHGALTCPSGWRGSAPCISLAGGARGPTGSAQPTPPLPWPAAHPTPGQEERKRAGRDFGCPEEGKGETHSLRLRESFREPMSVQKSWLTHQAGKNPGEAWQHVQEC